jgi:hypothetical protein
MGVTKRKRVSMDSAIADMSSESSCTGESGISFGDFNTKSTESDCAVVEGQFKRRKSSHTAAPFGLTFRDFGTAASQRPRRANVSQALSKIAMPQMPQTRAKGSKNHMSEGIDNTTTVKSLQALHEGKAQLFVQEVNGNNVQRTQTSLQDQAPIEFSTPPRTVEKTDTQVTPKSNIRRSTRERRPTERLRQRLLEQATPTRRKHRVETVCKKFNRGENSKIRNREPCIVCLKIPTISKQHETQHSMSFTNSSIHRQKNSDEHASQASQDQVRKCSVWADFNHAYIYG